MRHIILGNGAAAITAAEKLRELKAEDDIVVISREDAPAYSKCMLPDYVGGKMTKKRIYIRTLGDYRKRNIDLMLNCCVENIDTTGGKVYLQNGKWVDYDKLLIAIGGTSFLPPIEGLDHAEYYSINSVRDADTIREKASKGGKAVIMGGGLTGIEMAFALSRLGMKATLVEREPKLLPLQLDVNSSRVMEKHMEKEGITVLTATAVCGVSEEGGKCIRFSDGRNLDYDMLLVAVGTRPNLSMIKDSGIKYGRGILVDPYMKSSVEGVFAAGDVAEAVNKISSEYVTSYIWPNAIAQGKCAAYNMAGVPSEFSCNALMQNMVQMRDMPFISMGMVNPKGEEYEVLVKDEIENGIYKKLVLKESRLKGMILIGDTRKANTFGSLIRKEEDISGIKDTLLA